jgi:hypothetical protein
VLLQHLGILFFLHEQTARCQCNPQHAATVPVAASAVDVMTDTFELDLVSYSSLSFYLLRWWPVFTYYTGGEIALIMMLAGLRLLDLTDANQT